MVIDANKLADLVEAATVRRDVCIPNYDYYTERGWQLCEISYVNADYLVELLRDLAKDSDGK